MTDEQLDQTLELLKRNRFLIISIDDTGVVSPLIEGLNTFEIVTLLEMTKYDLIAAQKINIKP